MSVFPLPVVPQSPSGISRYTPITQIGRGSMAEVILAEMRIGHGMTKLAVLKRMWPDLSSDSDFVSMFVREARVSARMNHPNVVQLHDVLEDPKRPTIAMEYLDGQSMTAILDRLIDSNALGLTLRLRILAGVLAALDYAHDLTDYAGAAQGIVHRNVNPKNVFVTYGGQVKLLDFGMAKSVVGADQTRPGSVKGKLGYMAPEQVVGSVVDRRADIFAVGVMLWEMVAGRRLWQGMNDGEIVRHLAGCVPLPPLPGAADLPRGLDRICARALEVYSQDRYATAAEFAADLERLVVGSDDSHRRHLGKVVSLTFATERAARRSVIEGHIRQRQVRFGRSGFGAAISRASALAPAAAASNSERGSGSEKVGAAAHVLATPRPIVPSPTVTVTPAPSRVTARVFIGRWPGRWRWAPAACLAATVFSVGVLLPRVWPRAVGKDARSTANAQVAAARAPVARRSSIVIAPMTDPVAVVSPPPLCAVAPAAPVPQTRKRRAREREDVSAIARVSHPRQPSREDVPESPPAAVEPDDVLAPSVDLSGVPQPPAPLPPPAGERISADSISARQVARRSAPRPIDETDPFWP